MSRERIFARSAFTLVELLVVVAIIALLISILLPSLSQARALARNIKCASIQKQFATANSMYADSEDGQYVPIVTRNIDWQIFEWGSNHKFRSVLGDLERGRRAPEGLICPDLIDSHVPRARQLAWNGCYGYNHTGWGLWNEVNNNVTTGAHRPSVVQPADKLSLTETNDLRTHETFANYNTRWDVFGEKFWFNGGSNVISYRHQDGTNVTYFDGHVEHQSKEEVWYPDNGTKRARLWRVYESF